MNTLITGYDGFIGNALVGKLKRSSKDLLVGIDKEKNFKKVDNHSVDIPIEGDMRDSDLLRRVLVEYEIERVYHFASWPITRACSEDPVSTFDINVMGAVKLFEACRNYGKNLKDIIISTSDKAFGNAPVPYTEESSLKPLFIYDTSKACQQLIALSYARNYGLPLKIVACSNIYGPGDLNMTRVIPKTITRLAQDEPARLWKDSETDVREFVYIDDAVNAFTQVAEHGKFGEVYCCGGTEYLTIRDLMIKICDKMGKDPKEYIKIFDRPLNLMELKEQYIDSTKLKSIGWTPNFSLDRGLDKAIEFYSVLAKK